ncbi:hypothetical protein CcCBS67573_g03698 [Chytriomyces confervae]|uniref:dolichol kinase n=1 Tax=Chytriomyces confervae TaxID=246404 RepID=A0A507FHB3_9FUNG|nr:hypothetical protein CcCBS67573_g03698 [Chytriomyces confervae]
MSAETVLVAVPVAAAAVLLLTRAFLFEGIGLLMLALQLWSPAEGVPFTSGCIRECAVEQAAKESRQSQQSQLVRRHAIAAGLALVPTCVAATLIQAHAQTNESLENYLRVLLAVALAVASAHLGLVSFVQGGVWRQCGVLGLFVSACGALVSATGLSVSAAFVIAVVAVTLASVSLPALLRVLCKSFTLGEGMIISSLLVSFILDAVFATIAKGPFLPAAFQFERLAIHTLMSALILGMLLIGLLSTPILLELYRLSSALSSASKKEPRLKVQAAKQTAVLSLLFYGTASAFVLFGVRSWVMMQLEDSVDPFVWLFEFIMQHPVSRVGLICYWGAVVTAGIILAATCFTGDDNKDPKSLKSLIYLNFKRKYYHALAVFMFLPGYIADPDLMHLSFSVALAVLILAEYIRIFKIWPVGEQVGVFLQNFLDSKDQGVAILSHIYLLVGCALPVWICRVTSAKPVPQGMLGIITLGIADAVASIVGYKFGKNRWASSVSVFVGDSLTWFDVVRYIVVSVYSEMPSLHHIVVLGDGAVGKTGAQLPITLPPWLEPIAISLTIQYCLNNFVEHYDPTIEDSYRKQVNIDGETCVLEILDTAGQEEYSSSMGDQWLRRGDGFLLIYSITSRQSFARIKRFREQLARVRDHSEDISIVLVGNKCDMAGEREVSTQEGLELANRLKCEFIETSAKTKYNVESAFHLAVRSLRKSTHHKKKKGDCAIL